MKIGFLIYGSINTLSGGYLYDRKLVDYLRAQGDTVEIISLPWRNYAMHLWDNFSFKLPPNLDILIQDELNHPSLIGANLRRHPYPIVALVHHLRCSELRPKWQNVLYRVVEKKYLQSVDGFVFNSKTTSGVVKNIVGTSVPEVVAHPPIDRFGEAISENQIIHRAHDDQLRILFLGNIIERKGLHVLLEALRTSTQDLRVDVVGSLTTDANYAKRIQEFVRINGLSSIVKFHSSLDDEPLKKIMEAAHVQIVPSSYEGFGIVYLEGMAFGLPSIGTTAGAAMEIIEHGKNGYLIAPDDSPTLALLIKSLSSDREILTQLSLNARRHYMQQSPWNETAGRIRVFLQSMIG